MFLTKLKSLLPKEPTDRGRMLRRCLLYFLLIPPPLAWLEQLLRGPKIGRASCRERV